MNADRAIAEMTQKLPNADRLLVELAARLQAGVLVHDPGNPRWDKADVLIGLGAAEPVAALAGQLAGQTPRPWSDVSAVLARPGRVCAVLADAASAAQAAQAPAAAAGRLVVVCPASAPAGDWEAVQLAALDPDSLLNAARTRAARVWVHVVAQATPAKPAKAVAPAGAPSAGAARPADDPRSLELGPGLPALAQRMAQLGTETAFDVLAQVNALKAQGKDIISFGLGEPDFDTPAHIKETAKRSIDANETHYGPSQGLPRLREECARYIRETRGIAVTGDHIAVGPGAKPIIFDVMMALVNPGDEVIYPNPGYPIYESVIDWIGGKSVPVPLLEEKDWSLDVDALAKLITPKTRMIVLNSPQNPTGGLIPEADLARIAALAVKHNLWVISDEVYSQICFGPFASIASQPGMVDRTIIIEGFSKTYAMTGWRLGYGVMHPALAKRVARIETNIDSCTCTFTQLAGLSALTGTQEPSKRMAEQFEKRAKHIVDRLNDIEGVSCRPAGGAFYVFPNVTGACRKMGLGGAGELQRKLLHEALVAVLPRTCFGRKNVGEDQEYLRLSYATSLELIDKGLDRMKAYIEKGQKPA